MSVKKNTSRWLFYATVAVLVLSIGFVSWSASVVSERQQMLAEVALDRVQQMFRVRLDGLFHELEEDLSEEVEAIQELNEPTAAGLLARWRPLLRSHRTITAIRLADEFGGLIDLHRTDGTDVVLVQSRPGDSTATASRLPLSMQPSTPSDTFSITIDDPRHRNWFGRALEEPHGEPVWFLLGAAQKQEYRLQVSKLFRGRSEQEPFRILMFEVDLHKNARLDMRSAPNSRYGAMLLDNMGEPLNMPSGQRDQTMMTAEKEAAQLWVAHRKRSPFGVVHDDRKFIAVIAPYVLNGQTLYAGAVLDGNTLKVWTRMERTVLMAMVLLVALMVILLGSMWLRSRSEEARMRRQLKQSRAQEQLLAKVLGERDVLSREVHHRVKNNLQIVSSLLSLQASQLEDEQVRHEFLRGKQRIDTIALVHHKLYGLKDLRDVDLKLFFNALLESLSEVYRPESRTVSYTVRTANLSVDQDSAITLGILLCELAGNSFRHAFPYATGGHIDIIVQPVEGGLYRLVVKDNGKGLSDGFADGPGKLGLDIVSALAEQLDGSFHTHTNGGTTCEVLFRISTARSSSQILQP